MFTGAICSSKYMPGTNRDRLLENKQNEAGCLAQQHKYLPELNPWHQKKKKKKY